MPALESRKAVVTGIGVVTALGTSLGETTSALSRGEVAEADPPVADLPGILRARAFTPRDHFRTPKALKLVDRKTELAVAAAGMAIADAELATTDLAELSLGVLIGCSSSDLQVKTLAEAVTNDAEGRSVVDIPYFSDRIQGGLNPLWLLTSLPNMVSAHVAIQFGATGRNVTLMTDWIAGLQALGEAVHAIAEGELEVVLAGGADSGLDPFHLTCYQQEGLFDEDGGGPRLGEAAAMLVVESEAHARARGVGSYGELHSYDTCALPRSAPLETALARCLARSLERSGRAAAQLHRIGCARLPHRRYHAAVGRALAAACAPSPVPDQLDLEPSLGFTMAAGGALATALLLAAPDDQAAEPQLALSSALGYCGQAASLCVERAPGIRRAARQ